MRVRQQPRRTWHRRVLRFLVAVTLLCLLMFVVELTLSVVSPFPSHRIDELPQSRRLYAADGTLLRVTATDAQERVLPVPLSALSPYVVRAVICSEDERFFDHRGVDGRAVARAILQNLSNGRVVSGASTITMQVVRILMDERSRSFRFKVEQMFRARQLERLLSKEQILQIYCNHVPLGGAVCGFDAAARRWFGVGAARLDLAQAATLVAMLPAPGYRSPRTRPRLVKGLRDRLLERMRDGGVVSNREFLVAVRQPLGARRRPWPGLARHACDHFARHSRRTEIRTSLDLPLQHRVENVAAGRHTGPADGLAIVVLGRESAEIRAMLGSADYELTQLNTATCRRSVGSTLKPFLYALALECGAATERGLLEDVPTRIGGYRPANFSRDHVGAIGLAPALASSRNLPAVHLLRAVGVARFAELLRGLGLPLDRRGLHLDAALGTMAASPLQLATAYCRFVGSDRRVGLSTRAVRRVMDALSRFPIGKGANRGAVAIKTGTSSGRRDAWCVGITPEYVVVVWTGNLTGRGEPGLVGSRTALRLLTRVVAVL